MTWFEEASRLAHRASDIEQSDELQSLVRLCGFFGIDEQALQKDIRELIAERLGMWLLGEPALCLNFLERREVIERRLLQISRRADRSNALQDLVDFLTKAQARVVAAVEMNKEGLASLSEPTVSSLLEQQGFRCDVCGVPLRSNVVRRTTWFDGGSEPVYAMDVDHTLPFYFGGNDFLRILCKPCNIIKWDRFGVQEDGPVVCANHLRPRDRLPVRRRMAFWSLARKRTCAADNCDDSSKTSAMLVAAENSAAPATYGNVRPFCLAHAPRTAWWLHEQVVPVEPFD
jgi:hypothetical protein